jgi:hypothetical protein
MIGSLVRHTCPNGVVITSFAPTVTFKSQSRFWAANHIPRNIVRGGFANRHTRREFTAQNQTRKMRDHAKALVVADKIAATTARRNARLEKVPS